MTRFNLESTLNEEIASYKDLEGFNTGQISDGCHTFDELYEFRKVYNAALFNEWGSQNILTDIKFSENGSFASGTTEVKYNVHKSWKHNDGEWCFGEEKKWFIVVAILPTGQISNHYKAADWHLFKIPEAEKALFPFDGHTPQDVLERLKAL